MKIKNIRIVQKALEQIEVVYRYVESIPENLDREAADIVYQMVFLTYLVESIRGKRDNKKLYRTLWGGDIQRVYMKPADERTDDEKWLTSLPSFQCLKFGFDFMENFFYKNELNENQLSYFIAPISESKFERHPIAEVFQKLKSRSAMSESEYLKYLSMCMDLICDPQPGDYELWPLSNLIYVILDDIYYCGHDKYEFYSAVVLIRDGLVKLDDLYNAGQVNFILDERSGISKPIDKDSCIEITSFFEKWCKLSLAKLFDQRMTRILENWDVEPDFNSLISACNNFTRPVLPFIKDKLDGFVSNADGKRLLDFWTVLGKRLSVSGADGLRIKELDALKEFYEILKKQNILGYKKVAIEKICKGVEVVINDIQQASATYQADPEESFSG